MVVIVENDKVQDKVSVKCSSAVFRNVLCCVAMATAILVVSGFVLEVLNYTTNNRTGRKNKAFAIISRKDWGANPLVVDYAYVNYNQINTVLILQTNGSNCSTFVECSEAVRQIQRRDKGILKVVDIAYNFLIGGDGNVYEGTGWYAMHDTDFRYPEIRVAFIGDYSRSVLSSKQKLAFKAFLSKGLEGHISELFSVEIGCCTRYQPAFVGYYLFQYFYAAYFPASCLGYYLEQSWINGLCDLKNHTLNEIGHVSDNISVNV